MGERRRYHPIDFGERQWLTLVDFALQRADVFECAVPYQYVTQDLRRTPLWPHELNAFRADLVERYVSHVRWQRAQDSPTQFARFRLSKSLIAYVRDVGGLSHWQWMYDAPEDPTFYAGADVVLAADSVDGRIAVYADPAEIVLLASTGVRLVEPLGAQPEPWPTP